MHSKGRVSASRFALALRASSSVLACALLLPTARGQLISRYFDPNGTTAGLGAVGTSSNWTWNTSSTRWAITDTGTASVAAWPNATGSDYVAVFMGTAGSINVSGTVTTGGIDFRATGFTLASGSITLAGTAPTITTGAEISATISAARVGTAGFEKLGAGTLTLTNSSSSFSGTVKLSEGTLALGSGSGGALGGASLSLNGGTLASGVTGTLTVTQNVTVDQDSTLGGTGTMQFSTGTFKLNGNRTLTVSNTALTTLNNGLGETSAGSGFTKAGSGTLRLTAASTYTGPTTIAGGTLALSSAGTISGANLTLSGGGVLAMSGTFNRALGTEASQVQIGAGGGGFSAYGAALTVTLAGTEVWGSSEFISDGSALVLNSAIADNGLTWTSNLSLGDAVRTLSVATNTVTFSGNLLASGSTAGLIKTGAGTLVLSGDNSAIASGVTVSGGTLQIAHANALGAGPLTLEAGTLSSNSARTVGNTIFLDGATAAIGGTAALTFSGALTHRRTGDSTLTFTNTGGTTLGDVALSASEVDRVLTLSTTASTTISGVISNGGTSTASGLIKAGTGTLTLLQASTYGGTTTISAGTLAVGSSNALGTGPVMLGTSTLSSVDSATNTLANAFSLTSSTATLSGTRALTLTGPLTNVSGGNSILIVTNTGGPITLGAVALSDSATDRTLTFITDPSTSVIIDGVVSNGGTSTASSLIKSGNGTLTLTQANTYGGTTTISGGTLAVASSGALGSGPVALGTATLSSAGSAANMLANAVSLTSSTATLSGTRALTLTGTLTNASASDSQLNITNTSGPVTLRDIALSDSATSHTLTFNTNLNTNVVVDGAISNGGTSTAGGLTKIGAGTLTLAGNNTYDGLTRVSEGTLVLTGDNAQAAGGVTLESTGTLRLGSDLALSPSAALTLAGGTLETLGAPRTVANATSFSGTVTLGGTNSLTFSAPLTHTGTSSTLTFAATGIVTLGDIALANAATNGSVTLDVSAGSSAIVTGAVTNGGTATASSLTKSGAGTLTLQNGSSYDGVTTVTGGTLNLAGDHSGATGGLIIANGSTVQLQSSATLNASSTFTLSSGTLSSLGVARTFANPISLAGNSTLGGEQALTFAGTLTNISGANITLTLSSPLGVTLNDIALSNSSLSRTTTLVTPAAMTTIIAGTITNGGTSTASGLTKAGAGTLVLAHTNTHSGFTTINDGTLRLGAENALSETSTVKLEPLATGSGVTQLDLNGFNASVGGLSFGGSNMTAGATPQVTTGSGTLTLRGDVLYTNAATLGTASISGRLSLGSATRTFTVDDSSNAAIELDLSAVVSGDSNVGLIKAGLGVMALTGDNLYTGLTQVQGGTLSFDSIGHVGGDASALGAPTTAAAGAIKLGNGSTAATLAYTGTGHTTDRALELVGTFGGATLDAGPNGGLVFTNGISTTGVGAKTLTLSGAGLTTSEIRGAISGASVALTKSGAGTWLLTGDNSYTGATTVLAGTLAFDSIANVNAGPSALGDPANTTAGTIALGSGTSSVATLRYTGTGDSSNRTVRLDGHGTIEAAGTGALVLGNVSTSGAYVLTLTGDNTGSNTIGSFSGTGSLAKTGSGHWIVSGSLSLGGTTTISQGTLTLRSSGSSSGAVYLNSGGTLEIDGSSTLGSGTLMLNGGTLTAATTARTLTNAVSLVGSSTLGGTQNLELNGKLTHAAIGNSTLTFANPTTTLSGGIDLSNSAANRTLTLDVSSSGGTALVSGPIANGGTSTASGLTKTGAGTLVLSGDNTYSGSTLVQGGTLRVGNGSAFGSLASSDIAIGSGALLEFNRSSAYAYAGAISGGGSLLKNGSSTLTLAGPLSYTGTTQLTAGTLVLSGPLATGAGATTPGAIIFGSAANQTMTLQTTASFALDARHGITFTASPTLNIAAGTTLTYGGAITGAGGFYKYGTGTLDLAQSTNNSFQGRTVIEAGTLTIGADATLGTAPASATTGHLYFAESTLRSTASFTLNANRGINIFTGATFQTDAGTTLTYSGVIEGFGGLTKTGAGTLYLAGTSWNTYDGLTTVNGGTLAIDSDGRLGDPATYTVVMGNVIINGRDRLTLNGGTLRTTSTFALHADRGVTLGAAGGTFSTDAGTTLTLTLGGQITGSGALTKTGAGTLQLNSQNNFLGGTTISGGTVRVGSTFALGSGGVTVSAAGALLDLGGVSLANAVTLSAGGALRGSGGVGALTVSTGGILAPGASPGTLSAASAIFGAGGSYQWETNSAAGIAGTNWDLLSISGQLAITATSQSPFTISLLSLTSGNATGDVFNFASGGTYSFLIATAESGITGYTPGALLLNTAGFTNLDTGTWSLALTNGNRNLTLNYEGVSAIPEPSTYAALAGLVGLGLALSRRQRRQRRQPTS